MDFIFCACNPQKNHLILHSEIKSIKMNCQNSISIKCPCTYSCGKRGKCCECVTYHLRMEQFPACFFSKSAEATYDRSFEALKRDRR